MLRRFFRATTTSVTFAALLIGGASLLSRLIGVFRDRLLSGTFGAGRDLDIYYAAFRIPDFVYNLVVGGVITAGFIPVFTAYLGKDASPEKGVNPEASRLADALMSAMSALLIGGAVIGMAMAPRLVPWITPGFGTADAAQAVMLTRLMFLSPIFLGLSNVLGGILQTKRRFVTYSFAPVLYNVGIVSGTVLLAPRFSILGPALGVVAGSFLHFAAQLIAAMDAGYRPHAAWAPRHIGVKQIAKLTVPRLAGLGASQINLLIVTSIASTLGAGSIAVFTLANNLQLFPTGIVGTSFAVAAFPLIADLAAKGKREEFAAEVSRTTRNILFLIIPATVCLLLLRAQIVRVVLGSGKFDWKDTVATADTVAFFAISLFSQSLWPLLARACFAIQDVFNPLWAVVAGIIVERGLAWKFVSMGLGTPGLALAFSGSSIFVIIWLWVALRHKTGALHERDVLRSLVVTSVASVCMAFTMQFIKTALGRALGTQTFLTVLAQGAGAGAAGIAVFAAIAYMLGSEEMRAVVAMYRRKTVPVPVPEIKQEDGSITA